MIFVRFVENNLVLDKFFVFLVLRLIPIELYFIGIILILYFLVHRDWLLNQLVRVRQVWQRQS